MKMDRLISIIMILLGRTTISAKELAQTFEVSTRTIYRDIDTIAEAGIPIVTYQGQNGGIGIMKHYKVDKRLFTQSDIRSLLIGLRGVQGAISDAEMTNTLAKIKGMIPNDKLSEIEFQTNQIAIDLKPWVKDNRINDNISLVKEALLHSKIVRFSYTNINKDNTSREVEPYRLLHKGSSWYLQGYCLLRKEFRTFRFQRMEFLELTDNLFVPRKFDLSVFDICGVMKNPMVEVLIKFDEEIKKSIIEIYGDGVITYHDSGIYIANILIFDNEQGYNSLFIFGDKCECIFPKYIREYILKKAMSIAKIYKNSTELDL